MVIQVHENATYSLREFDGTRLKVPIAEKRVKIFKQRDNHVSVEDDILEDYEELEDSEIDEDFGEVV